MNIIGIRSLVADYIWTQKSNIYIVIYYDNKWKRFHPSRERLLHRVHVGVLTVETGNILKSNKWCIFSKIYNNRTQMFGNRHLRTLDHRSMCRILIHMISATVKLKHTSALFIITRLTFPVFNVFNIQRFVFLVLNNFNIQRLVFPVFNVLNIQCRTKIFRFYWRYCFHNVCYYHLNDIKCNFMKNVFYHFNHTFS